MRILIINTDYPAFLRQLYSANERLEHADYREQRRQRNASLFGVFDAYSKGFCAAGHDAIEVHANNSHLQSAWMREHGISASRPRVPQLPPSLVHRVLHRLRTKFLPAAPNTDFTLSSPFPLQGWDLGEMMLAQVRDFQPDVILNQSVSEVGSDLLMPMRRHARLIVGQIASPLPKNEHYRAYDMMISSLPNYVDYYRRRGIDAHLNRLGFDPRALAATGDVDRSVDVSFVGSLSPAHAQRVRLIEHLARVNDISIWGNGVELLDADSPIRKRYHGEAWGIDMFRVLGASKITINSHIGIAETHANNMRLFEATGMGSLLITDRKSDIADLFEPGREVICYDSAEECAALIEHYRNHDAERREIAAAGQQRTLRDHNYDIRTRELATLFSRKIARRVIR